MRFEVVIDDATGQPVRKGNGRRMTVPRIVEVQATLLVTACVTVGCARTVDHRPLSVAEYEQIDLFASVTERWWGDVAPFHIMPFSWKYLSAPGCQGEA